MFNHYAPGKSRYCTAELDATDEHDTADSKRVGKHIKIIAEVGIAGIIKGQIEYIKKQIETQKAESTAQGYSGHAAAQGDWGHAEVKGKEGIAVSFGIESKAAGALGCYIVLAEWKEAKDGWHIKTVKCAKVDGEKIKANTFYRLKNGKFVEASNE